MSAIFWDTNLFIYLIEDRGELTERVVQLANRMTERGDRLYTSTLALGEVLVRPTQMGNDALCQEYESLFARRTTLIAFDAEASRIYATIRQKRSIRPPDAIHLACAARARVDLFITNDDRLAGNVIPGIQFILPLRAAFL